jgi:broad specificity phosphatase PhoE
MIILLRYTGMLQTRALVSKSRGQQGKALKAKANHIETMRILQLLPGFVHSLVTMKASTQKQTLTYTPLAEKLPPLPDRHQRIFLIRHGETDWNAEGKMQGGGFDIELNDAGKLQAEKVAKELTDIPFGVVASSHLVRAKATAAAILAQHETAKSMVLSGFGEMRFGTFEGLSLRGPLCTKEITQKFQRLNDEMKLDKQVCWPEGESIAEVETRARAALQEILDMGHSYVCVVAHGRTNNILLASLLEGNGQFFFKFHQGNCCINVVDVDPNGNFKKQIIRFEEHIK